jgi:ABC-type iron transport system FetAB permease component
MDSPGPDSDAHLTYGNVGLAFSFILFDAFVSFFFGLGVGSSLVTAAVRCVLQLAVVATLLQKVFDADNPWAVAGIAGELDVEVTKSCELSCEQPY